MLVNLIQDARRGYLGAAGAEWGMLKEIFLVIAIV